MCPLIFLIYQTQHLRLTALTNLQSGGHYGRGIQEERQMVLANHSITFQAQNLRILFPTPCEKLPTPALYLICANVRRSDKNTAPEQATSLAPKKS